MLTAKDVIALLKLEPHPEEGGYFAETYRSTEVIQKEALPDRHSDSRSVSTAIYYLLTPETFSEMHRLKSDEVFHFYLGDPVEMLQLWPNGSGRVVTMGQDIAGGMKPQLFVLPVLVAFVLFFFVPYPWKRAGPARRKDI